MTISGVRTIDNDCRLGPLGLIQFLKKKGLIQNPIQISLPFEIKCFFFFFFKNDLKSNVMVQTRASRFNVRS